MTVHILTRDKITSLLFLDILNNFPCSLTTLKLYTYCQRKDARDFCNASVLFTLCRIPCQIKIDIDMVKLCYYTLWWVLYQFYLNYNSGNAPLGESVHVCIDIVKRREGIDRVIVKYSGFKSTHN